MNCLKDGCWQLKHAATISDIQRCGFMMHELCLYRLFMLKQHHNTLQNSNTVNTKLIYSWLTQALTSWSDSAAAGNTSLLDVTLPHWHAVPYISNAVQFFRISDTTHSPNGVIPHPRCLATSNSRKIFHIKHRQTTCLTVMLWLSKCLRSTSPCDSLASLPTVCWNWLRSRSTPSSFFASDCTESSSFPKSLDVSKGHFSRIHVSASFASA